MKTPFQAKYEISPYTTRNATIAGRTYLKYQESFAGTFMPSPAFTSAR